MKYFKFLSVFALFGALFLTSCSTDDKDTQPTDQQIENKSFFHDLFHPDGLQSNSRYTTFAAGDYAGTYTGTYVINSMLAGSGPGDYDDVEDKSITITVNETAQTIDLEIEPFKVGSMPAYINIIMENIPYTESGNTVHFQGTQINGFSVMFVDSDIDVDGTITKSGTTYTMELNFLANGSWGSMIINADVDFTGTK
jgi:hypothetical protein